MREVVVGFSNTLKKPSCPENALHVLLNTSFPDTNPEFLNLMDTTRVLCTHRELARQTCNSFPIALCSKEIYSLNNSNKIQNKNAFYCIVYILISTISPCTTALKLLYDPSNCTSTVQLSKKRQRLRDDHLSTSLEFFNLPLGTGPNDRRQPF